MNNLLTSSRGRCENLQRPLGTSDTPDLDFCVFRIQNRFKSSFSPPLVLQGTYLFIWRIQHDTGCKCVCWLDMNWLPCPKLSQLKNHLKTIWTFENLKPSEEYTQVIPYLFLILNTRVKGISTPLQFLPASESWGAAVQSSHSFVHSREPDALP